MKPTPPQRARVDAGVLKVNRQSARIRILGEEGQVTFRSGDVWDVVPGHLVTLAIHRRWTWRADAYASGEIEDPRIDVAKLGLEPLPLQGGELEDVASDSEPYGRPDPYAPLWEKFTARPRPSFEFDGIAWGALPGLDPDGNPTCEAAELIEAGDREGARELLMETLGQSSAASTRMRTWATWNSTDGRSARWSTTRSGSGSGSCHCRPALTGCWSGGASTTGRSCGASTATDCASGGSDRRG